MASTCPNCSRVYSRLDNLKRHAKYSCTAKNRVYDDDERGFRQVAKVPEAIRIIQNSNKHNRKTSDTIHGKQKNFKPNDDPAIQEEIKLYSSPLKKLVDITQRVKPELESYVRKRKIESEDEGEGEDFGQHDDLPSMTINNDAADDGNNEDEDEGDINDDDDDESDISSEYEIEERFSEYWEDPNDLVDRMRQLLKSQSTGSRNKLLEIISIINELREAGIIK